MPALLELQRDFAAALRGQGQGEYPRVRSDGVSSQARVAIYRNNLLSNYLGALQAVYPVVLALTGGDWFRQTARAYSAQTPSSSGDIQLYGADFAAWLASLDTAQTLPYLADVARLEWAVHRVFHAADLAPLAAAQLARVAADDQPQLQFQLHPACRLLQSDYPVQRIWTVNQPGYSGDQRVQLDAGGVSLLVQRQGATIQLVPLTRPVYQLLEMAAQGRCLDDILNRIPAPLFADTLASCFAHRCFSSYSIKQENSHAS